MPDNLQQEWAKYNFNRKLIEWLEPMLGFDHPYIQKLYRKTMLDPDAHIKLNEQFNDLLGKDMLKYKKGV